MMSVKFDVGVTDSWTWTCPWGCYGFDHESEQEARDAETAHQCLPPVA